MKTGLYFMLGIAGLTIATAHSLGAKLDAPSVNGEVNGGGRKLVSTAELKAALKMVPQANRPVGVLIDGEGRYQGFPPVYVHKSYPVYLFDDGLASNCARTDPLTRDFQALQNSGNNNCRVWKWRQTDEGVQLEKQPGHWQTNTDRSKLVRFRSGEKPGIRFVYSGAHSLNKAGAASQGTTAVGSQWGGGLMLAKNGRIELTGWSSTLAETGLAGAFAESENEPVMGQYYLDGNLIAIAPDTGGMLISYISGIEENGALGPIYLGGQQYWDPNN